MEDGGAGQESWIRPLSTIKNFSLYATVQKTFDWQADREEEETGEAEVSHIVFNSSFLSDQTNKWAHWVDGVDVDVLDLPEVIGYIRAVDFS